MLRYKRFLDVANLFVTCRIFNEINEMLARYKENVKAFSLNGYKHFKRNDDLVSIIIPTKNEAKNIQRLIKSLRCSHHKNIEIIVVDYMSNDGTQSIARSLGAYVIDVDKPGVGYASFVGTSEAKGDIIIRTDADAIFPPHIINYALNVFKKFANIYLVHLGHIYFDSGFVDNLMAFLYDKYWRKIWKTTGHFIAFRKEVRDTVNFNPNLKIHEDFDFGQKIYETFGAKAIHYSYRIAVFVSARRIKISGKVRYFLGYRVR
ncbi:MAG: glycosyltransferase [Candidatus Bathyarchaeia archaeon]